MLEISKISHVASHTDAWLEQRMGRITASRFGELISSRKNMTQVGISYLYARAGEIVTGELADEEFFNDDVNWGNAHEPEAIKWAVPQTGMNLLRDTSKGGTHRLIVEDEYAACTPDALLCMDMNQLFDSTGERIKVRTLEVKCPKKHHRFIALALCETPQQLKGTEKNHYWQVIFQMMLANCLTGYYAVYSPKFPIKGKVIEFNKMGLAEDFKLARLTLDNAKEELKRISNYLRTGIKN